MTGGEGFVRLCVALFRRRAWLTTAGLAVWQWLDFNSMRATRTRPARANWLLHVPASRRLLCMLSSTDWGIEEASELLCPTPGGI